MKREFKPGQLYRYAPDRGKWCRHGLRLVTERDGKLYALDTYWGEYQPSYCEWPPVEQIAGDLEFILDLNDARITSRDEYDLYRDEDRAWIPIGGAGQRFYVRKGASPDPQKQLDQARYDVEKAESALKIAQWDLDRVRKALAEIDEAVRAFGEGA